MKRDNRNLGYKIREIYSILFSCYHNRNNNPKIDTWYITNKNCKSLASIYDKLKIGCKSLHWQFYIIFNNFDYKIAGSFGLAQRYYIIRYY